MNNTVTLTIEGSIARVAFNRPEAMNGLNDQLPFDLYDAMQAAKDNDDIRVVILEGNGKCFMAGGDLNYFKGLVDTASDRNGEVVGLPLFKEIHGAVELMRSMPKPIIAKVHGAIAGIGMSYMLACDLVVAADSSVFTMAYPNIGITPDGGSTWHLPRAVGSKKAFELALLSPRLNAEQALDAGLINQIAPEADLETSTDKLCQKLLAMPTWTLARTKALLNASASNNLTSQLELEARYFSNGSSQAEFAEGVTAFTEKRRADFTALNLKPSEFDI